MDFTEWTSSEEGEDCKVGRKDSHSFLGRTRYNSYRLPSKQTINGDTTQPYWTVSTTFQRKNIPIWQRRKCSSIKTMHGLTQARHRWPNSTNSATNCFPIFSIFARFNLLRLFPKKKWFEGKRFTIKEQLIAETEAYFEGLDKSYYSDGLKKLENHWIKYMNWAERRLYWEIIMNRSKKNAFYYVF